MFLDDPRRKPLWRYERAKELVATDKPPHAKFDDDFVKLMRDFYLTKERLHARNKSEREIRQTLKQKYGALETADRIFADGRSDRTRYGIEAYLLTGSSPGLIGELSAVSAECVTLYEQCFFHVLDRLESRNWVASEVIGPAFQAGFSVKSPELIAKYFGYFGGPVVLDFVLTGTDTRQIKPEDSVGLELWLDSNYKNRLRMQGVTGMTFMEPNNYSMRTLIEGYQGLLSLSNKLDTDAGSENTVNKAVSIFLDSVNIPIGNAADKLLTNETRPYANGEVSPRVSQRLLISQGQQVDVLEKLNAENWESPKSRDLLGEVVNGNNDQRSDGA